MGVCAAVGVDDGVGLAVGDEVAVGGRSSACVMILAALLFLPSILLGTISPVVAKLAVRDLARTGRTVRRIYAAGAAGSIAGTFATGYWLIAWSGTHTIVWSVALVLLALGVLLVLAHRRRPAPVAAVALLIVVAGMASGTALAKERGWLDGPCTLETNYFCIRVHDAERDGHPVRILTLDRLVHSHSSLDDPTRLVYGYEQMYAEMTEYASQRQEGRLRRPLAGATIAVRCRGRRPPRRGGARHADRPLRAGGADATSGVSG